MSPWVLRPHCPCRGFTPPLGLWGDVPQWSRLLTVPSLCSAARSLAGSRPLPPGSIFPSPQIHFSAWPTFQKAVNFLFLELLLFFSSISGRICRCSEWFDSSLGEFLGPDDNRSPTPPPSWTPLTSFLKLHGICPELFCRFYKSCLPVRITSVCKETKFKP